MTASGPRRSRPSEPSRAERIGPAWSRLKRPATASGRCGSSPPACWWRWRRCSSPPTAMTRPIPGVGFVKAFAEAAMVGGLADWFAVTALFRHPLGLPIPHTAIIPRNKDRIGDDAGRLPARQFPDPQGGRPADAQCRHRRRDRPLPRQPAAGRAASPGRLEADRRPARIARPGAARRDGQDRGRHADALARSLAPARPGARGGDHRGAAHPDPRRDRHLGRAAPSTPTRS